jgi:hypothetical protein
MNAIQQPPERALSAHRQTMKGLYGMWNPFLLSILLLTGLSEALMQETEKSNVTAGHPIIGM